MEEIRIEDIEVKDANPSGGSGCEIIDYVLTGVNNRSYNIIDTELFSSNSDFVLKQGDFDTFFVSGGEYNRGKYKR